MNNFYTILVIPEKTKQVKKVVLPSVYVRVGLVLGSVGAFFLAFMVYDYVNVMKQLSENKRLQTENRQLKQQMQTFTTKLQTVQDALDRIQSYTTKLRIITNQAGENSEQLKKKVAPDIPGLPMDDHSDLPPAKAIPTGKEGKASPFATGRLLADNTSSANTVKLAEGNAPQPLSSNPPPPPPVQSQQQAQPGEKKDSALSTGQPVAGEKKIGAEPAQKSTGAPLPATRTLKPRPKKSAASPGAENRAEPILSKSISSATDTAVNSNTGTATETKTAVQTQTQVSATPLPSPKLEEEKKLSDLIREDEEQESAALRKEFEKLHLAFDSVLQHALGVELDVESLTTALLDQRDYLSSLPTLKPTNGWYTSGFGVRSSPFTGKSTMHEGLDLANHVGSAIVATAAGVVTYAGARPGYGNLVTVNHGYGIQTQYGHISRVYVKLGEKVKRGQKIAAVGNTGRSTGPHVHYEVRVNGIPLNPYFYILED